MTIKLPIERITEEMRATGLGWEQAIMLLALQQGAPIDPLTLVPYNPPLHTSVSDRIIILEWAAP